MQSSTLPTLPSVISSAKQWPGFEIQVLQSDNSIVMLSLFRRGWMITLNLSARLETEAQTNEEIAIDIAHCSIPNHQTRTT